MRRVVGPHVQLIHQNFEGVNVDLSKERTVQGKNYPLWILVADQIWFPSNQLLLTFKLTGKYDLLFQHFQPLMSFRHLHDEVFQVFREIGNIMVIMKLFDSICLRSMVKYTQFNVGMDRIKQVTKSNDADLNKAYTVEWQFTLILLWSVYCNWKKRTQTDIDIYLLTDSKTSLSKLFS